jgi:hypothetical protein
MDFRLGPFLIPLGAFAVAIVAIIAGHLQQASRMRVKAEQRMAMVARGMSPQDIDQLLGQKSDDARAVKDPIRSLGNTRKTAMILMSTGLGLVAFGLVLTWIVGDRNVLAVAASGLMPLAIGIGFLVDYRLQKRDLSRFGLEVGPAE